MLKELANKKLYTTINKNIYIISIIILLCVLNILILYIFYNRNVKEKQIYRNHFLNISQHNIDSFLHRINENAEHYYHAIKPKDLIENIKDKIKKPHLIEIDFSNLESVNDKLINFRWLDKGGYVVIDEYEIINKSINNRFNIENIIGNNWQVSIKKLGNDFYIFYPVKNIGFLMTIISEKKIIEDILEHIPKNYKDILTPQLANNKIILKYTKNTNAPKLPYLTILILFYIIEIWIILAIKKKFFLQKKIQNLQDDNEQCYKSHMILKSKKLENKLSRCSDFMKNIIAASKIENITMKSNIILDMETKIQDSIIVDSQFFAPKILQLINKSIIFGQENTMIEIKIISSTNKNILITINDNIILPIKNREKISKLEPSYNYIRSSIKTKGGNVFMKEKALGLRIVVTLPIKNTEIKDQPNIIGFIGNKRNK